MSPASSASRRHRVLFALVFVGALTAAQWLLGPAPAGGALCGTSACLLPSP